MDALWIRSDGIVRCRVAGRACAGVRPGAFKLITPHGTRVWVHWMRLTFIGVPDGRVPSEVVGVVDFPGDGTLATYNAAQPVGVRQMM